MDPPSHSQPVQYQSGPEGTGSFGNASAGCVPCPNAAQLQAIRQIKRRINRLQFHSNLRRRSQLSPDHRPLPDSNARNLEQRFTRTIIIELNSQSHTEPECDVLPKADRASRRCCVVRGFVPARVWTVTDHTGSPEEAAAVIIAETGGDMAQLLMDKNLTSWSGVCPGNKMSADRWKSRAIKRN